MHTAIKPVDDRMRAVRKLVIACDHQQLSRHGARALLLLVWQGCHTLQASDADSLLNARCDHVPALKCGKPLSQPGRYLPERAANGLCEPMAFKKAETCLIVFPVSPDLADIHLASFAHLTGQNPIDPCHPSFADPGRQFCLQFLGRLKAKIAGQDGACALAHAVGQILSWNDEVATIAAPTAHHDMRVGMLGVEMVNRDPVEPGFKIDLHLTHEVTDEGFEIIKLLPVFG